MSELERRLVELEIRSEERRADVERLETFVGGYEGRIQVLEAEVRRLRELLTDRPEAMPPPEEDLPPHY